MQESGLTEIICFIWISALWSGFSHLQFLAHRSLWGVSDAVWYPELFFLGALGAQKFTFGGPELRMAMTSLFIGVAGNNPFHTPQSNWLLPGCPRGSEIHIRRAGITDGYDILVYWCGRK